MQSSSQVININKTTTNIYTQKDYWPHGVWSVTCCCSLRDHFLYANGGAGRSSVPLAAAVNKSHVRITCNSQTIQSPTTPTIAYTAAAASTTLFWYQNVRLILDFDAARADAPAKLPSWTYQCSVFNIPDILSVTQWQCQTTEGKAIAYALLTNLAHQFTYARKWSYKCSWYYSVKCTTSGIVSHWYL